MRRWWLQRPAAVLAVAVAVTWTAAWLMGASYDALNRDDTRAGEARWLLGACLFVCLLGLAASAALVGRTALWLLLPGLAGLLFLADALETLWSRWGMDWNGQETLLPPVVLGFVLFAIALVGLRRSLGPQQASKSVAFPAAFFLAPITLFAWMTLARFSEVAHDADTNWTSEHGDPALGAVAVLAALVAGAVVARRRLRP
jgi:xanthine/uracil permease